MGTSAPLTVTWAFEEARRCSLCESTADEQPDDQHEAESDGHAYSHAKRLG